MSRFTLTVRNLLALRNFEWTPEPVSVLVGPNGAGKTTALLVLKLLRAAIDRGWPQAVAMVLGGRHTIRSFGAADDEPIAIEVHINALRWRVEMLSRASDDGELFAESLYRGDEVVFARDDAGRMLVHGEPVKLRQPLTLRTFADGALDLPEADVVAHFMRSITVYHDPDLFALRAGSDTTQSRHLHSRGQNALTMLRQWHQRRPDRSRYSFVLSGLRAAFPGLIEDLDFEEAGTTLAARIYQPGRERSSPLGFEANGLLSMLISLCALAASEDGGVVAIDEPENALHPFALGVFARRAEWVSRQRGVTVILSTHAPVLLDHFDAHPEQIYVLDPSHPINPMALTTVKNPDWLRQFRLGMLYADGEIGSNADVGRPG